MCTDVHAAVTGETGCQSFQKMTVTSRQIQSDTFERMRKRRLKTRTYFKMMGTSACIIENVTAGYWKFNKRFLVIKLI